MGSGGDGDKAPALPLEALLALGLDQRTAENALVNHKVTANLAAVIAEVMLAVRCARRFGFGGCYFLWLPWRLGFDSSLAGS